jgi:propionate CoA-transferase
MASFNTAETVASQVKDGDTIALTGSGSLLVADKVLEAIEKRFLTTGSPRNLTLVHALGIGDAADRGLSRLAHKGLVKRVIGGHWSWSPRMQKLAVENEIEAYALPGGVIGTLLRESGARRPGLITRTGIGSFVDPRIDGGRLNSSAKADIVEVIEIGGEEFLRYLPIKVDLAIIKASISDSDGNVSFSHEPSFLDSFSLALGARGNGGKVVVQVKEVVDAGTIPPMSVHIPSTLTDEIVVDPEQWQTYESEFNPAFHSPKFMSGQQDEPAPQWLDDAKMIIVRRAAQEVQDGDVVNVGFGMSSSVVDVLRAEGRIDRISLAIEQGAVGGNPVSGALFGVSEFPQAVIPSTMQFDSFATKLIDCAVLGLGELDVHGNVNVSKLGRNPVGPGGFIDIIHGAKKSVFCGTFSTKGLQVSATSAGLSLEHEGSIIKVVDKVEQITFASSAARQDDRSAVYVTERAVFEMSANGITLIEIAPGVDPEKDVIAHLPPGVETSNWKLMDVEHFRKTFESSTSRKAEK